MRFLNYIGSKHSVLKYLNYVFRKVAKHIPETPTVLDAFAGSGSVSYNLAQKLKMNVVSNDLEYYSYIINYALLCVPYTERLAGIIAELNQVEPKHGLITEAYSPAGSYGRRFWTDDNAMKADGMMALINALENTDDKIFCLASLLSSLDVCANNSCVYTPFTRYWTRRALKPFVLKPIHTVSQVGNNKVLNLDARNITGTYDIVYLDPPYNWRQYAGNYSPLNYIAKYDPAIELNGNSGIIKDYNRSVFSAKAVATQEFEKLINGLNTKYIIISYNNEGLIPQDKFRQILEAKGALTIYSVDYRRYQSEENAKTKVVEYIYLCQVGKIKSTKEIELI